MNLTNYDTSAFNGTDGSEGLWVGIGLGGREMPGTDVIVCTVNYTNNSNNDKFWCREGTSGDDVAPDFWNTSQPTYSTVLVQYANGMANYSVQFVRKLSPNDPTVKAYPVIDDSIFDIIWAYGDYNSDGFIEHTVDNRGAYSLDLATGEYDNIPIAEDDGNSGDMGGSGDTISNTTTTTSFALSRFQVSSGVIAFLPSLLLIL